MNLDSMLGQNHDLYHEFPEFVELIDVLKDSDNSFAQLAHEYTEINREVIRIEQGVEPCTNEHFEDIKKLRLLHKDKIYAILRTH